MAILNTPKQINAYVLASLIAALKIEINTGLKMSRGISLLKQAKAYGVNARTKADALAQLEAIYATL